MNYKEEILSITDFIKSTAKQARKRNRFGSYSIVDKLPLSRSKRFSGNPKVEEAVKTGRCRWGVRADSLDKK